MPALLALATAVAPVVTSAAPDAVSLTVYRAPYGRGAIDLGNLDGFALVTETRRLRLPRGRATVRFEGVADGIVPVSALVDGIPTLERNRDARLLSPASLVDGTLGREVTLTRTDRATGKPVSEPATIVAGPSPGVVLRTASGIETLRCSGLPERLTYPGVPAGLSAKPVLSVTTDSAAARTVTVRLSYLASGFDWRASYVATVAPAGDTLDLFGWLTLANGNGAFPAAQVQAVAGRLNRVAVRAIPAAAAALSLHCYPLGTTTSGLSSRGFRIAEEIVVTGSRVKAFRLAAPAVQSVPAPPPPPPPPPEDLGDLKLYRVPERVTVAARAQKQVALLARAGVRFEPRYRLLVTPGARLEASPTARVLVVRNEAAAGLGIALPAGGTAVYAAREGARLLVGLGALTDRASGETLRLAAGTSAEVQVSQAPAGPREAVVTVGNANGFPVRLELPIGAAGQRIEGDGLDPVDGVATWSPLVPAGGEAVLRYRY